jgi:hypothetical protein
LFVETCPAFRLGNCPDGFGFDGREIQAENLAHSTGVGGLGRDHVAALNVQPFDPDLNNGD